MNFYNECDRKTAAWLRELIKAKLIPDGIVDERSITEIKAEDLRGFTQCHFFAGIGGWCEALRLAGWPANEPVWTGSCSCQPFSAAGSGKGAEDPRHLWPAWFRLIRESHPDVVLGEQVEAAIRHGWLDGVCADLEGEGYAVGAVVLGAHSVGAPHIRQRLYWVADARGAKRGRRPHSRQSSSGVPLHSSDRSCVDRLADAQRSAGESRWVADVRGERIEAAGARSRAESGRCGTIRGLAESERAEWWPQREGNEQHGTDAERLPEAAIPEFRPIAPAWNEPADSENRFILCRDNKIRRIPSEPAFFPLVDGVQAQRVGILRGAGNAIVLAVAAAFIEAYCESRKEITHE